MTANTNTTETKRQRGRKVAAILAGGLVLGVGTMATLASWNDSEFANATFTAGSFGLEGATSEGSFTEHATAGAAGTLTFTAPFDNLTPTDTVYASFAVRLTAGTTHDADVTVSAPSTSGNVGNLTYTLIQSSSWTCDAGTTGTELVASQAVGGATGAQTFELSQGTGGAAGQPAYLCFKVTAGADLVQEQSGSATWQFQATSN